MNNLLDKIADNMGYFYIGIIIVLIIIAIRA